MIASNQVILSGLLLLMLSIFPSIRVFSNESDLCIKFQSPGASASASVLPMNSIGLIPFWIDLFDLLDVQRTLRSLPQHHSTKALILWCSAFFVVQLSHPYRILGQTIALNRWTFVSKVMSLLFNMLSRFAIACLPRSKHLSFMAAVTGFSHHLH